MSEKLLLQTDGQRLQEEEAGGVTKMNEGGGGGGGVQRQDGRLYPSASFISTSAAPPEARGLHLLTPFI